MKKIILLFVLIFVYIVSFSQNYSINISDSPTTGLKRKVVWNGGFYFNSREKFVKLFTICEIYKNENGAYGEKISTLEIKPFERILTTTNNIKVNPLNGKQCYSIELNQGTEESPQIVIVWKQKNDNSVVANVVGQFDFFEYLIFSGAINIPQLISSIVLDEDQVNKSYDK